MHFLGELILLFANLFCSSFYGLSFALASAAGYNINCQPSVVSTKSLNRNQYVYFSLYWRSLHNCNAMIKTEFYVLFPKSTDFLCQYLASVDFIFCYAIKIYSVVTINRSVRSQKEYIPKRCTFTPQLSSIIEIDSPQRRKITVVCIFTMNCRSVYVPQLWSFYVRYHREGQWNTVEMCVWSIAANKTLPSNIPSNHGLSLSERCFMCAIICANCPEFII